MIAAYPNSQVADATIKVYLAMLREIDIQVLTAAIQQCMAESKFLPSVAEIRDKAIALITPIAPEPLEAWGIVVREIKRTGFYAKPQFENPIIAAAVEALDWQALCTSENQIADRAHFSKVYEALVKRAEQERREVPIAKQLREQTKKLIEVNAMPKVLSIADHVANYSENNAPESV